MTYLRCNFFSNSIGVSITWKRILVILLVFCILLRIPKVLGIGIVYQHTYITRTIGDFSVDYVLTIFDIFVILISSLLYFRYRVINVVPLLLILAIYNVFRWLLGYSTIFDLNSYEIIFSLLVVLACGNIIAYFFREPNEMLFIFSVFVGLLFASQLLYFTIGRTGTGDKDYGVGYGALGINSGALGLVYSLFALTILSSKCSNFKKLLCLIIAFFGLILTGSRTNLLLFLLFSLIHFVFFTKTKTRLAIIPLLALLIIFLFLFGHSFSFSNIKLSSVLDLFQGNFFENVFSNLSVKERIDSWNVAFLIIQSNPLGLSASATDLMNNMFEYGGITFPHSYLLCYFLLFGVGALVIYYCFLKEAFISISRRKTILSPLLYCLVVLTFYGGISTEYILFFFLFVFLIYCKTINGYRQKKPIDMAKR